MSTANQLKAIEDRKAWRAESMARMELAQPDDLKKMFGLLAQTLSDRRREAELDLMRVERFHADHAEMVENARIQRDRFDRQLEIASGILKMMVVLDGELSLIQMFKYWMAQLPLWREQR